MNYAQAGKDLAKLETNAGSKVVSKVKETLISLTSDEQVETFLDSYLETLLSVGETEKEAKNYRSRVKAILKTWKDHELQNQVYAYETKSIQILARYARELSKGMQEGKEEGESKTEKLLSIGDISAELDRLAQHLHAHGKFEQAERLMVLSNEVLEENIETATM